MIRRRTLFFIATLAINSMIKKSLDADHSNKASMNTLKLPSFTNAIEVKSSMKGRVRFFVPTMKNNEIMARHLIENTKSISVVKSCQVNVVTGTVLVEYDDDRIDAQTIEGALIKILGIDALLESGRVGEFRKKANEMIDAINNGLYDYSKGILDLKSLVILGFLSGAVYDAKKFGARRIPDFATLLWWSSSLF